jgi:hypothetical protein
MNAVALTSYQSRVETLAALDCHQWLRKDLRRAMKSTVHPPAHAPKKACNQVFPEGALDGAGLPRRIPCACSGSKYVFHMFAPSSGVRLDCPVCCGL